MKWFRLFSCVLMVHAAIADAQTNISPVNPNKPLRTEIPVKSDNETYQVIPCGSDGLILFFKSLENAGEGKIKWYFSSYDPNLKQRWLKFVGVPDNMEYKSYFRDNDTLAILFSLAGKDRGNTYNYEVVRLILSSSVFLGNFGKTPVNSEIGRFVLNGSCAYLGINEKNSPASVLIHNLTNGRTRTLALSKEPNSTLIGLTLDTLNQQFFPVIKKRLTKSESECYILTCDTAGQIISECPISTITPVRELNNVIVFRNGPGRFMVFATYHNNASRNSQRNSTGIESTGFYTSRIEDNVAKSVNFYNFTELKNANNLVSAKDAMALKKKASRVSSGLSEASLDLSLLLHSPVLRNGEYVLLAESYFPQYHSENFTDFDFYGRPYTNTYTVFDGYRFNHGMLTAFDQDGKLLWDNNMEIHNLLSAELNFRITDYFSGGEDILSYLSEGKIGSKVIRQNEVVEKLDFTAIDLLSDEDKLLTETKSRMVFWYSTYFLCYGYQEIKNIREGNTKRLVFYINKIRIE